MTKLDKSKYTKSEIQTLLKERRKQKLLSTPSTKIVLGPHTNKEYGFVIGNGVSRNSINLNNLKQFGKVYACNAVYREFDPDYLVAVDVKMVLEINNKKYQHKNPNVWTNPNKSYRRIEHLNFFNPSKGWSSGPTALWLAAQHGYEDIYILGFDYKGMLQGNKVNNIYAGSENYKKTTDTATYYGNWLKQTAAVIKENPEIRFHRIIAQDNFVPDELNKFSNLKTTLVEEFQRSFGII
jgi:hypothetical protein|tara:strand:- start:2820 stop:3533 length:714 start_codon:yes stop_codon:yes gene_type:complete